MKSAYSSQDEHAQLGMVLASSADIAELQTLQIPYHYRNFLADEVQARNDFVYILVRRAGRIVALHRSYLLFGYQFWNGLFVKSEDRLQTPIFWFHESLARQDWSRVKFPQLAWTSSCTTAKALLLGRLGFRLVSDSFYRFILDRPTAPKLLVLTGEHSWREARDVDKDEITRYVESRCLIPRVNPSVPGSKCRWHILEGSSGLCGALAWWTNCDTVEFHLAACDESGGALSGIAQVLRGIPSTGIRSVKVTLPSGVDALQLVSMGCQTYSDGPRAALYRHD